MSPQLEYDFPPGHPGRSDYDPTSPEAIEWARIHVSPLGARDFPVGHPKALDTPGNLNHIVVEAGVDPLNPHREAHTGRTPEQVAGIAELSRLASEAAKESPVTLPLDAAVVNSALDSKRVELGRDLLTEEEYSGVIAEIHRSQRSGENQDEVRARVEKQHQALQVLLGRGYTRNTAMELIAREGADKVLGGGYTPSLASEQSADAGAGTVLGGGGRKKR